MIKLKFCFFRLILFVLHFHSRIISPTFNTISPNQAGQTSNNAQITYSQIQDQTPKSIYPWVAFEITGRYGFTPVFNQIIRRTIFSNYFVAGSLPVRFGNGDPSSLGLNIQLGLIFN